MQVLHRISPQSRRCGRAICSWRGQDLAEFAWYDPEKEDGCYRAWDVQWGWYTCDDPFQIDQGGRSTGKTVSMKMRAFAFPFNRPGQKMLITAPELNHLRPIVDESEKALLTTRLGREMLPDIKGNGSHGVSMGIRDRFFEYTEGSTGGASRTRVVARHAHWMALGCAPNGRFVSASRWRPLGHAAKRRLSATGAGEGRCWRNGRSADPRAVSEPQVIPVGVVDRRAKRVELLAPREVPQR
jgi:hypothetical protein